MDKENAVLETLAPDGGVSKGKGAAARVRAPLCVRHAALGVFAERSRKELLEQWRASKQNAVRKPL